MTLKIGFTGTSKRVSQAQLAVLERFAASQWVRGAEFHHGDCIEADCKAHVIFKAMGWRIVGHPPLNPSKRAWCNCDVLLPEADYLVRNHAIVDAVQRLLATPQEFNEQLRSGTWATVRYARKVGRPLILIKPDGSFDKEPGRVQRIWPEMYERSL